MASSDDDTSTKELLLRACSVLKACQNTTMRHPPRMGVKQKKKLIKTVSKESNGAKTGKLISTKKLSLYWTDDEDEENTENIPARQTNSERPSVKQSYTTISFSSDSDSLPDMPHPLPRSRLQQRPISGKVTNGPMKYKDVKAKPSARCSPLVSNAEHDTKGNSVKGKTGKVKIDSTESAIEKATKHKGKEEKQPKESQDGENGLSCATSSSVRTRHTDLGGLFGTSSKTGKVKSDSAQSASEKGTKHKSKGAKQPKEIQDGESGTTRVASSSIRMRHTDLGGLFGISSKTGRVKSDSAESAIEKGTQHKGKGRKQSKETQDGNNGAKQVGSSGIRMCHKDLDGMFDTSSGGDTASEPESIGVSVLSSVNGDVSCSDGEDIAQLSRHLSQILSLQTSRRIPKKLPKKSKKGGVLRKTTAHDVITAERGLVCKQNEYPQLKSHKRKIVGKIVSSTRSRDQTSDRLHVDVVKTQSPECDDSSRTELSVSSANEDLPEMKEIGLQVSLGTTPEVSFDNDGNTSEEFLNRKDDSESCLSKIGKVISGISVGSNDDAKELEDSSCSGGVPLDDSSHNDSVVPDLDVHQLSTRNISLQVSLGSTEFSSSDSSHDDISLHDADLSAVQNSSLQVSLSTTDVSLVSSEGVESEHVVVSDGDQCVPSNSSENPLSCHVNSCDEGTVLVKKLFPKPTPVGPAHNAKRLPPTGVTGFVETSHVANGKQPETREVTNGERTNRKQGSFPLDVERSPIASCVDLSIDSPPASSSAEESSPVNSAGSSGASKDSDIGGEWLPDLDSSSGESDLESFFQVMKTPRVKMPVRDLPSLDDFIVHDSDMSSEEDDVLYVTAIGSPPKNRSPDDNSPDSVFVTPCLPPVYQGMKTPKVNTAARDLPSLDEFIIYDSDMSSNEDDVFPDDNSPDSVFVTPCLPPVRRRAATTLKKPVSSRQRGLGIDVPLVRNAGLLGRVNPIERSHSTGDLVGPATFLRSLDQQMENGRRHPQADRYVRQFKKVKEELTAHLFKLYNDTVFDRKLPEDMSVTWNKRLNKTAGFCAYSKRATDRKVRIELSVKVCDTAERVRDTLIHELCHAAVWLLNGVNDGHGPHWKYWARAACVAHPELPAINRCHKYKITHKYIYKCTKCGYEIGRHSKSLDTKAKVCGYCRSPFALQTKSAGGTPRTPNKFALFVKENYGSVKRGNKAVTHKDVMTILSSDFARQNSI